jgi:hypothetical protein
MTDEQIEAYRQRLNELTGKCSDNQPESRISEELKKLAREVGASTCVLWVHPCSSKIITSAADTSELIRNIHQALQTASMANMCKTATQGYEMATKASRNACIHYYIAAAIAFLSVVAAWYAAIQN